jgi:tetratricopeptide (TPR) repeat protein
LLAASSIDELAGVMGHEIAHVQARHYARMREKSQIPDLLANVAAIGLAAATQDARPILFAQSANIALKLKYSREFETEADEYGSVFVARAGFDPNGLVDFFDKILSARDLPPYLYSHPDVEERIESVQQSATTLRAMREPDPTLSERFREVQSRLSVLARTGRSTFAIEMPEADLALTDPHLERAHALIDSGDSDAALASLVDAALAEPLDPRVPYAMAELMRAEGRDQAAIAAYRRTLELDPSRANVYYGLGLAYKATGQRHHAIYALEQATLRSSSEGDLRERARWEVLLLTFGVVADAGFADGRSSSASETPAGMTRFSYGPDDERLVFWAQLTPRFVPYAERVRMRWRSPDGVLGPIRDTILTDRIYITAAQPLPDSTDRLGDWMAEVVIDDKTVHRARIAVTR